LELTFFLRSRRAKKLTYIRVIDDVQMYTALQTFAHTPNFTIIVTDIVRTLATHQIKYKQTKSTTIHKRLSTHRNTLICVKNLFLRDVGRRGWGQCTCRERCWRSCSVIFLERSTMLSERNIGHFGMMIYNAIITLYVYIS